MTKPQLPAGVRSFEVGYRGGAVVEVVRVSDLPTIEAAAEKRAVEREWERLNTALANAKGLYMFRQAKDGKWGPWERAELGIRSLLVKAQDRDDYEVERLVSVNSVLAALEEDLDA